MKVGIDTFGCDHGRSGLGSYLLSLVRNLPADDESVTYDLFGAEIDRYTYTDERNFSFTGVNVPDSLMAERFWHTFKANSFGKKQGYDVILYSAGSRMLPYRFTVPGLAVVNDIVSNLFEVTDDKWLRQQVKKGLSRADCVIAPSNYIRKDLERSGIQCRRVEVIHNGINHSLFYPGDAATRDDQIVDIKPFAIKCPYLIYASRMQSTEKRHVELIRAFTAFKQKTKLPHRLVIAGSEGPYGEEVRKAAFASGVASDIFITGYFPHENFPELYRHADACIVPSVNEGVGLSVLEAMASGLPVACSRAGALPEIVGNNALFFESDEVPDIAAAIERIVTDEKLRATLIQGGIEWTKRYSWEKTARETLQILKSLVRL